MKEVLESVLLEYEKSSFIIDLVKLTDDFQYIEVQQKIHSEDNKPVHQVIKINPSVLDDIIEVLKLFQLKVPQKQELIKQSLSEEDKTEIQNRYLKGVPIKDLTLQFNRSEAFIEKILRNRGITIAPNTIPYWLKPKKKKRI
jgi:hypothetical protein